VKIEADSNDITERPHERHTDKLYSCAHSEKCFNSYRSVSVHMNVHSIVWNSHPDVEILAVHLFAVCV